MSLTTTTLTCQNAIVKLISYVCLIWWLVYLILGGSDFGHDFYNDLSKKIFSDKKAGVPLLVIASPLFTSASIALLLKPSSTSSPSFTKKSTKKSSISMNFLSFLLVGLPCLIYCISSIQRHVVKYEVVEQSSHEVHDNDDDECTRFLRFLHEGEEHHDHCCRRFLHEHEEEEEEESHSDDGSSDDHDDDCHFRFLHGGHHDDDMKDCCTRFLHEGHDHDDESSSSSSFKIPHPLDDKVMDIANTFAYTALLSLTYLPYIPTSRHSILRSILFSETNTIKLLTLHVWCTRICVLGVLIHGTMHMYRWSVLANEHLWYMLIPSRGCWKMALLGHPETAEHDDDRSLSGKMVSFVLDRMLHGDGDDEDEDHDEYYSLAPKCHDSETECTCYDIFRNFTGFLALMGLLLMATSSLNSIRRTYHLFFYAIHVILGPLVLIMMILHWNRMVLFLSPGILYYLACTVPSKVYWFWKKKVGASVKIVSVRDISNLDSSSSANGGEGEFADDEDYEGLDDNRKCVSLVFEVSSDTMREYSPGQYVRLCAPEIESFGSHPFTVNRVPSFSSDDEDNEDGNNNAVSAEQSNVGKMEITFRCAGPFTKKLRHGLLQQQNELASDEVNTNPSPPVMLLMDGFFGNEDGISDGGGLLSKLLQHESVVLIAGGVGITPYLSLLADVGATLKNEQSRREEDGGDRNFVQRKITLHWICRDPTLMDYMIHRHFVPLIQQTSLSSSSQQEMGLVSQEKRDSLQLSSIKIVVHDTNASSVPSSGLDSTGLEIPSASSGLRGLDEHRNSVVSGKSQPMSSLYAASSGSSSSTILSNLPHFLTFISTTYIGLAIIWYCYKNVQDKHKVGSRFWGIFFSVLWTFVPSIFLLICMKLKEEGRFCFGYRRYEGKTFETLSLEEEDGFEMTKHHNVDENEGEEEQEDADNASSNFVIDDEEDDDDHDHKDQGANGIASSPANGTTSITSSSLVTVEKSRGRPCIKTLLDEGLMSQHQSVSKGVFSCGPTPMMNIVKDIVHGMSRGCFKSCAVSGDVALYEETFEM